MSKMRQKLVENWQRRNVSQILTQKNDRNLTNSVVRTIYFPESSRVLQSVFQKKNSPHVEKEVFLDCSENSVSTRSLQRISELERSAKRLFCFFPNYSPQKEEISSDYPILEVEASFSKNWYLIGQELGLHFFFCSVPDLSSGMILDVFEADPIVHQTSGPVYEIYTWSNDSSELLLTST